MALGAALLPLAASAQRLPTVSEDAIGAAARGCVGLSSNLAPTRARLNELGWKRGSLQSPKGKPVAEVNQRLEVYSRQGVLLMLAVDDKPGCVVMAKVRGTLQSQRVAELVTASLGKRPFSSKEGQFMWSLEGGQGLMVHHVRQGDSGSVRMVFTPLDQKKN